MFSSMFKKDMSDTETVSILNDPFSQSCVEGITIRIHKHIITRQVNCYSTVEFKNGQTEGTQKIGPYPDYSTLMIHLSEFIKSLTK